MALARVSSRNFAYFALIIVYFLAAAASFNGFYSKWQFRDGIEGFSMPEELDGTAVTPLAYRPLAPWIANGIDALLPPTYDAKFLQKITSHDGTLLTRVTGPDARRPQYSLRYHLVYYLAVAAMFGGMIALWALCRRTFSSGAAAAGAPLLFALFFPFFMSGGGYYYDFFEVIFLALAAYFAARKQFVFLLLLTIPATLNKETFLFFLPTLFPFFQDWSIRKSIPMLASLMLVSGLAILKVRSIFAHNQAMVGPDSFYHNILFYVNPVHLLGVGTAYGVMMFRPYGIVFLALIIGLVRYSWEEVPRVFRSHILIAFVINMTLFILFCAPGEMRDLSLLYPGLTILVAAAIQKWVHAERSTPVKA